MDEKTHEFEEWIMWPEWAKDAVVVDTDVHLSLGDALRLLWKRKLTVTSKTFVPVEIAKTHSLSRVHIARWRRPRHGVLYRAEAEMPEAPR